MQYEEKYEVQVRHPSARTEWRTADACETEEEAMASLDRLDHGQFSWRVIRVTRVTLTQRSRA